MKAVIACAVLMLLCRISLADPMDDAEAKRRGITVQQVQIERLQASVADAQTTIAGLRKQLADVKAADAKALADAQAATVKSDAEAKATIDRLTAAMTPEARAKLAAADAAKKPLAFPDLGPMKDVEAGTKGSRISGPVSIVSVTPDKGAPGRFVVVFVATGAAGQHAAATFTDLVIICECSMSEAQALDTNPRDTYNFAGDVDSGSTVRARHTSERRTLNSQIAALFPIDGDSMDITDEVAAQVLAKCARRCCICRRFKPTRLQVHHIDEKAKGGSNEPDNLIALCLTCHTDVHTRAPFTRRFTTIELKAHRDAVYKLVAHGKLSADDEEAPLRFVATEPIAGDGPRLMPEAVTLLIELAKGDGSMLEPSSLDCMDTKYDRAYLTHRAAFKQLVDAEFIEFNGGAMYVLTLNGLNAADVYITLLNEKAE